MTRGPSPIWNALEKAVIHSRRTRVMKEVSIYIYLSGTWQWLSSFDSISFQSHSILAPAHPPARTHLYLASFFFNSRPIAAASMGSFFLALGLREYAEYVRSLLNTPVSDPLYSLLSLALGQSCHYLRLSECPHCACDVWIWVCER